MMITRPLLAGLLVMLSASTAFAQGAPAQAAPVGAPVEALVKNGQQVYDYWCATCHGAGRGRPGTIALTAKYKGTDRPGLLADRTDLSPAAIRLFVRNGISIMPMFRKTEVSDADLDAIAAYLTRRRAAPAGATAIPPPRQP